MRWIYNDGGRAVAGLKGRARDCFARSVAIAAGIPYKEVYDGINRLAKTERLKRQSSARAGVFKITARRFMSLMGWTWIPTMEVGAGCRVHLRAEELPAGRLVVSVSRHYTAVIDGVIHDTHDPSRGGARCVYGYWRRAGR